MSSVRSQAVLIDTMVVSSIINGVRRPDIAARYRTSIANRPALISFVTVTELRYGALRAGWGDLRRRALERDLARFTVVQADDQLMQVCAELRATCHRAGHPLGQKVHEADRWIAASAIRLGIELVSDDSVFVDVPNLKLLNRS